MATIGALAGFKMFMAAATRPLTGLLLSRMSPYQASNIGYWGWSSQPYSSRIPGWVCWRSP